MEQTSSPQKTWLLLIALLGWFALISQFVININSGIAPLPELFIRYFSYFTILTNLLVTICCTFLLFNKNAFNNFFKKPTTLTAITVYILVVGIIYNLILRFIWEPKGLQKVVDEILHLVIPVLFLIYWLIFIKKDQLVYKNVFPWLLYPFIYAICVLARGMFSGFYPYPFIDVKSLGINKALVNIVALTGAFLFISLLFISIGKFMTKRKLRSANTALK